MTGDIHTNENILAEVERLRERCAELERVASEAGRAEAALRLDELRLEALLRLNQMTSTPLREICLHAMEEAVRLTQSTIGYLAFVNADETVLTMYTWSVSAMRECQIKHKPVDYPVKTTGLWGEALRQRRPIITNDYAAPNPLKRGTPKGHVAVHRHMNVPIFDGDHIVIVAGVGNKPTEYDDSDVRQLTLLMTGMWRIVQQKRAEEENRKLEDRLAQAQKLESIGRLAGGVAHDFNNLLTTISGYTGLAQLELKADNPLHGMLEEVIKATQSASALTRQLLVFSRKQAAEPRLVNLSQAIESTRKMLSRVIGENIELQAVPRASGTVRIDPGQVEQIIVNLAVNARDAMPDGGRITIETADVVIDASREKSVRPGNYVMVTVSDTGCGMTDEVKRHLFEPFFTTKPTGAGTGLGLATIYGIVRHSGGMIEVDSAPGKGTAIKVYLPRAANAPVSGSFTESSSSPCGGTETIMVVEDETHVRDLAVRLLQQLGYKVLAYANGEEALLASRQGRRKVDLILTDVIMPGMNGRALAAALRAGNSGIKVLFTSGYTKELIANHGVLDEGINFIAKPYTLQSLAAKVREILDGG